MRSAASAAGIRRAHARQAVAAVQSEYSIWARDPGPEVLPTCEELGIGFVPWSPLGQGFLTGTVNAQDTFDVGDVRTRFPGFTVEARQANQPIIDLLNRIGGRLGATPAQVALAWLLAQKPWVVPIPGTRQPHRLAENLASAEIELTAEDVREIDEATSALTVHGARGPGDERYG